jgi:hypothetical protein
MVKVSEVEFTNRHFSEVKDTFGGFGLFLIWHWFDVPPQPYTSA